MQSNIIICYSRTTIVSELLYLKQDVTKSFPQARVLVSHQSHRLHCPTLFEMPSKSQLVDVCRHSRLAWASNYSLMDNYTFTTVWNSTDELTKWEIPHENRTLVVVLKENNRISV